MAVSRHDDQGPFSQHARALVITPGIGPRWPPVAAGGPLLRVAPPKANELNQATAYWPSLRTSKTQAECPMDWH